MNAKQLISLLQKIDEKQELRFTVKDSYAIYGKEMEFYIESLLGEEYIGISNGNTTTIRFTLNSENGKNSKITFR